MDSYDKLYTLLKNQAIFRSSESAYYQVYCDDETMELKFSDIVRLIFRSMVLTKEQIIEMLKVMTIEQIVDSWFNQIDNMEV